MRGRANQGSENQAENPRGDTGRPGAADLVSRRYEAIQRREAAVATPAETPSPKPGAAAPPYDWAAGLGLHLPTVQLSADAEGASEAAVHAHAAHGLTGPATVLPHAEEIQRSFGPDHDVSAIHAHVGGVAADAATAIGARAYASGDGVAFATAPDVHTAAHEAAHVFQQRAGVQLKGGVGSAGDPYERQADAIADRVVAGQSAADLMPASVGGDPASHVQRQPAGDATAEVASDIAPTADDVAAAGLADGDATFDVKWIESLPARMLDQIDGGFAASKQSAAYKKALASDRRLREIEAAKKKAKQGLTATAAAELGVANNKKNRKQIEQSETYTTGSAAIDGEYADEVTERKTAIEQKIKDAGNKGKSWDDGRLTARMDFMSWGVALLGSAEAVKSHFLGLTMIKGGAYLSAPAAARYNQATAWFEATYPGSTFPRTSVGQALRGRHHGEHSKGLQGHPLGISLDFDAYVNVHQKDGVASFMLRKFGGGPNSLNLGDRSYQKVQEMGATSAAGGELSEAQVAYLKASEKAYDDMFATSERFKEALGPSEAKLKDVQTLYYSVVAPGAQAVAAIERELTKARRDAAKRAGKGSDGEAAADVDPKVIDLEAKRDATLKTYEAEKAKVQAVLEEVFSPWIQTLEGEVATMEAAHEREDLDAKVDLKTAERCLKEVERVKKPKALRAILSNKRYASIFVGFSADFADDDFRTQHQAAVSQAKQVRDAKYQSGEIVTRVELIRRFRDPRAVFGTGEHVVNEEAGTDRWQQKREVSQPPIIQYLETGFARNDEMGATDARQDAEVFNGEFITGMMRFGWYPGAAWGAADTMHFDFLDGFGAIVGTAKSFGPAE